MRGLVSMSFLALIILLGFQYFGKPKQPAKPAPGQELFRVVLLGDSHGFGWGVAQGDTFAAHLADALRDAARPGKLLDVVNMSVPGYNSVQEAELFLTRGLALRPRCVAIQYCLNDNILPTFLTRRDYLTDWHRLYLLDLNGTLRRLLGRLAPNEGGLAQEQYHVITPPGQPDELDPKDVPTEYLPLLGWDRLAEAYALQKYYEATDDQREQLLRRISLLSEELAKGIRDEETRWHAEMPFLDPTLFSLVGGKMPGGLAAAVVRAVRE